VHDDEPGAVARAQLGEREVAQPARIVDERSAGLERGGRDLELPRVHGDDCAVRGQLGDERHDALDLGLG
jgi:hypothetical protein